MDMNIQRSLEILERTPDALAAMLDGIGEEWTMRNEGGESWSVFDILGHLIHGERTDWIPRARIIISDDADKRFEPFDRFAQFSFDSGLSVRGLLKEFGELRAENIAVLRKMKISARNLGLHGIHPNFGKVTLGQLLAAWTVHDLNHIAQISRVMARQYSDATGPWKEFLGILNR